MAVDDDKNDSFGGLITKELQGILSSKIDALPFSVNHSDENFYLFLVKPKLFNSDFDSRSLFIVLWFLFLCI